MSGAEHRRALGAAAEAAAAELLCQKGLRVLARNWRKGRAELDIVARDNDTLVFVEVRARAAGGLVSPLESVTPAKRRAVCAAARLYLAETRQWDVPCRFDLVTVLDHADDDTPQLELEHFADAW